MEEIGWKILAPGLTGVVNEIGGALWISTLVAIPEGQGACSRYLDSLPVDQTIVAVKVINPKLAGMLERRGFHKGEVMIAGVEPVEAYVRPAPSSTS